MDETGILSRLDERSAWTLRWLERIDARLEDGDDRMNEMTARIAALEKHKPVDSMSALERWIKIALPYLIGAAALAVTGSIETAVRLVATLAGR